MGYSLYIIYLTVFLLGLVFYIKQGAVQEGFLNTPNRDCPNLLIQKGSDFYLYNRHKASIPGINPIRFSNLEDYTEFLDWQRSQGIQCPVLYLQSTIDATGHEVYQTRPCVLEPQHGIQTVAIDTTESTHSEC